MTLVHALDMATAAYCSVLLSLAPAEQRALQAPLLSCASWDVFVIPASPTMSAACACGLQRARHPAGSDLRSSSPSTRLVLDCAVCVSALRTSISVLTLQFLGARVSTEAHAGVTHVLHGAGVQAATADDLRAFNKSESC